MHVSNRPTLVRPVHAEVTLPAPVRARTLPGMDLVA